MEERDFRPFPVNYHFLSFLVDFIADNGILVNIPNGTNALDGLTTILENMKKNDKQRGCGPQEFDPNTVVDLLERDGNLYCVTAGEVIGKGIRAGIRAMLKKHDAKAFLVYKEMKKDAKTRDERSAAYEHLVFTFMNSEYPVDGDEKEMDGRARIAVAELAMSYHKFDRQHLALLETADSVRYIVKCFQAATYTIPML